MGDLWTMHTVMKNRDDVDLAAGNAKFNSPETLRT